MSRRLVTRDLEKRLIDFRRRLHERPELSNQEVETTEAIRSQLLSLGIEDVVDIDPTGLVVDVGPREGTAVAVRADIDALPLQEASDLPFASEIPGRMHACGHDVHTSCVLGAIALAKQHNSSLPGRIRFIFQPAEEYEPLGARAVIAQGHLEGVSAIIGLHVDPTLGAGKVSIRPGAMMSGSDVFTIRVTGVNSHAGWPQDGRDALAAAAAIIEQAYSLKTREIDPRAPLVLHFGRISGGSANNIVAEEVVIEGVIRTLDRSAREQARGLLNRVVDGVSATHRVDADLNLIHGEPIMENDPSVVEAIRVAAGSLIERESVVDLEVGTLNGEDFSFYLEHVRGAMAWLGVRNEELGYVHPLHHPCFAVDERAISIGAELLYKSAVALINNDESR